MAKQEKFKYPGVRAAMDGNSAVILCERESTDAAGAYPITPSTQMGELWSANAADGYLNIAGRPLIFIEPEGEHAAAAVTAGLAMTGLRATNFSSGQGIAYMHESLYAAVGKRLTYVLNVGCRAITKASLNVHAGHDDYHAIDDTGFFQVFAKNVQETADLNIIAHRIAEMALNPGVVAQDGFLTTHVLESYLMPERELIEEFLGLPEDIIDTPTPAQRLVFGPRRRRIPELWDVDNPVMLGISQNQESYAQMVAGQRPFFFDHIEPLAEQAMDEYYQLTGRRYGRIGTYLTEDADYLLVGQGSVIPSAEVVAEYLRKKRNLKVGVVNLTFFRPFPGDALAKVLAGRKGVTVLERLDQPLAEDLPLMRETRAAMTKAMENGQAGKGELPHPRYPAISKLSDLPPLYSASFGMGSRDLQPEGLIGAVENMLEKGDRRRNYYLSLEFLHENPRGEEQKKQQEFLNKHYPHLKSLTVKGSENPDLVPEGSLAVRFHSIGGWGAMTTGKNMAMTMFEMMGYHIKANPKYGSEKKGQPTNYYMAVGPEPIRINCEYFYVDAVLSPDPNVFNHSNALEGLKEGGTFIIQSELDTPEKVWAHIPARYRKIIREKKIRLFYLDAFKIAREESSDIELQFRMQGIAFQGAFFAASPLMKQAGLTRNTLFKAIEDQLRSKFGSKGARVVEDNLRVVRRGFDELLELKDFSEPTSSEAPAMVAADEIERHPALWMSPKSDSPSTDIYRFWDQVFSFYHEGKGAQVKADPFISMGLIPAATSVFRDMTGVRFEYPMFHPEKCTGCGKCWTVCPDSAIPGLVSEVDAVLRTAKNRLAKAGRSFQHLDAALPKMAAAIKKLIQAEGENSSVQKHITTAITPALEQAGKELSDKGRQEMRLEMEAVRDEIGDF
ncbi:MAG: 2-oxoacid:acceptor oxidoreductase family protein, partial [Deltaproteobacteria bacterium]|nr:2-oxoacid:acceptor oxidoreductase family protein [Deltaproteobacteria bacterium]